MTTINTVPSSIQTRPRADNYNVGKVYGNWFIVCVIGGFLLSTSVASKLQHLNDANTENNQIVSDSFALDCTAHQIELVSRSDWSAQPPKKPLEKIKSPVLKAIIAHTASKPCTTKASCKNQVQYIQKFHIESRGWDDIGYNFLVGGDGAVYVGRGWDNVGAHTKGYNQNSIGIAFIGTYETVVPTPQQLCAAQKLLEQGRALGKLTNDYGLYGHRQLTATTSPGTALYKIIQTWAHWRKTVTI